MIKNNELTKQHTELVAITLSFCAFNRLLIGFWENQILLAFSCICLLGLAVLLQNMLVFKDLGWIHLAEKYSKKKRYQATVMGHFFPHHFHIKSFNKLAKFDIISKVKIILAIILIVIYAVKLPVDAYTVPQALIFLSIFTMRMNFYPLMISWLHIIVTSFGKFGGNSKFFLFFIVFVACQGIFFTSFISKKEQDLKLGYVEKIRDWNHRWLAKAITFSIMVVCVFAVLPKKKPEKSDHLKNNKQEKIAVEKKSEIEKISQKDKEVISENIEASATLINTRKSIEKNESEGIIYRKIDQIGEKDAKQISKNLGQVANNKLHAQKIMKNELHQNKKKLENAILRQYQKRQKKVSEIISKSRLNNNFQQLKDLTGSTGNQNIGSGSGSGGYGDASGNGGNGGNNSGYDSSYNNRSENLNSGELPRSLERKINDSMQLSQLANQMEGKEDAAKIKESLANLEKDTLHNIQSEMGLKTDSNNKQEVLGQITQNYKDKPNQSAKNIRKLAAKEIKSLDESPTREQNGKSSKDLDLFPKLKQFKLPKSMLLPLIFIFGILILLVLLGKKNVKDKNNQEKKLGHSKKHARKTKKNLLNNCNSLKAYTPKDKEDAIHKITFLYNSLMTYIVQSGYERPAHLTPDEYEFHSLRHFCKDSSHGKFVTNIFVATLYGKNAPNLDDFHKFVKHVGVLCIAIEQHQKVDLAKK